MFVSPTPSSYVDALTPGVAVFAEETSTVNELIKVGSSSDRISVLLKRDTRELTLFSLPPSPVYVHAPWKGPMRT